MMQVLLFLTVLFLAYSNGANDNFKGVATLFGTRTTTYKGAIRLATLATLGGSISSIFLSSALVQSFSGKGIVPDTIAASPGFVLAIALAAGLTVIFATQFGFPISTTHSLTGALAGAGLVAVGPQLNLSILGSTFFLPLIVSPFLSVTLATGTYIIFRSVRLRLGITEEYCLCVGTVERVIPIPNPSSALSFTSASLPIINLEREAVCSQRYHGLFLGINAQKALNLAHYVSASVVSFARGLNDTPKVVALIMGTQAFQIEHGMLIIGLAMSLGGLLNAQKVAETMSHKITPMNHGQGFTANLITGFLVIFASRLGLPVSTTHVSVGSLFGIGLITRKANYRVVSEIFASWLLTLPTAAILSGLIYWMLTNYYY